MDHLVAGLLAGATSTAVLQPIDVIKVRYQVWNRAYPSLVGAFTSIIREEGIRALYKGLTPAMLGSSVSWGLYLHLYENAKAFIGSKRHSDGSRLSYWENMLAATSAGCTVVLITNPIWMIKTRMQLQKEQLAVKTSSQAPYTGIIRAFHQRFNLA
jgi:solute carrier family 25 folate transporter 32